MNCDQAFDRLTDPAATTDSALARHLEECPRCQAMRQTLSPALDWLKSSSDDEGSSSLHAWNSSAAPLLTAASIAVAMETARRLPRQGFAHTAKKAMGIALVAMFGMALGVLVIGQKAESKPPVTTTLPAVTNAPLSLCLWTRPERTTTESESSAQSVVDSCIACHVPTMLRN